MENYSLKAFKKHFSENGIFYTSEKLATILASYIDIKNFKTAYDPTCGRGNLLRVLPDNILKFGQELNGAELETVKAKLASFEVPSSNQIIMHLYKSNGCTITIYKTKVLLIQGNNAKDVYKQIFDKDYTETDAGSDTLDKSSAKKTVNQNTVATMGSDEVGVGDFFGGIVVASAYVSKDQIAWLKEVGVKDSKLLNDEKILKIYDEIKDKIPHNIKSINAIEYNELYKQYGNGNVIKAVLHNQALWDLSKEVKRPYFVIMDQFAQKEIYATYLRKAHKTEFTVDIFETKAESKYIAVACASIIARAAFLHQIKALGESLGCEIILGSSNENIKALAKQILQNHGQQALGDACKQNFITYREIIED